MTEALSIWYDVLEELGIVVLTAKGQVDGYTHDLLQKRINETMTQGYYKIILDLSGVSYISSAGLGVFIASRNRIVEAGGSIVLMNLSKPVRDIFKALSMDDYMNVAANMQDALQFFETKKKSG